MRKFSVMGMLAALVISGMVAITFAATEVTDQTTLEDNASSGADSTVFQDYSDYPGTVGKSGKIVRFYDFAKHGGAASSTIYLYPKIKIKDNTVIRDGYIKVMTAVAPLTGPTNSIQINTTSDLLTAGTNLLNTADAFVAINPVGTVASYVQATNDLYVTLATGGIAITNGKFMVVLDCEMAP